MGIAATTFTTARTAENFKAWYAEAPQEAQAYLKTVAVKTGNVTALTTLDQLEQTPGADPAAAIANVYTQVDATALAATQAARATTLGWQTNGPPKEAPSLTGRMSMDGGTLTLTTPIGPFTVKSINPVGANDPSAFVGRVVTVKGWPDASWQPGGANKPTLIAEEWGPGTAPATTGRVAVTNGEVLININPNKNVKVTDPTLKAALLNYAQLGIVLPGEPELQGTELVYSKAPENYYILSGFNAARAPATAGDKTTFSLQLAHGKTVNAELPTATWNSIPRTQRHYLFGHFEAGNFKALGMTPTAGSWSGAPSFTRGTESVKFVEYATPVGPSTFTEDESKFGL